MAQPNAYNRQYDFTGFSASSPSDQQPGAQLDAEFNALKTTTDQIRANLQLIQRDDGALANASVSLETLDAGAVSFISGAGKWGLRGAWATTTLYAVADVVVQSGATYICAVGHVSGTFATDLAAGKWIIIYDPTGTIPADDSVTTAKLADGAVTLAKLGFSSIDLTGSVRGQAGVAAGSAVAATHLIYGKSASGDVRNVMERATRTQGAVGFRWVGGTAGYIYELVQDSGKDTLSFRLVGGQQIADFQTDGRSDWGQTIRVTGGAAVPAAGAGMEMLYNTGIGYLQAFDRDAVAWKPIEVRGLTVKIVISGVTLMTASSTGADFTELSINGTLVGYRGIPNNGQNGNYTLVAADAGKCIYSKNSGAQAITIPTNASVAYSTDTAITIINNGTTALTIVPAGGVSLIWAGVGSTGTRTLAVKGMASIKKVESDTWFISGAGLS